MQENIDWIRTLIQTLPKSRVKYFQGAVTEDAPKLILMFNVQQLMSMRGIKSAQKLSDKVSDSGLSLSKAQVTRILNGSSDSTTSALIKLSAGLGLNSEDYFYLLSPQGFDDKGMPIAKYSDINHETLIECAQDAYTVLADERGDVDVPEFIKMAVTAYKSVARSKRNS